MIKVGEETVAVDSMRDIMDRGATHNLSIVLTGGGTAGHVLPNIALLPGLRRHFGSIYYFGGVAGAEKGIARQAGLKYYSISTGKLRRSFSLSNLMTPFKVAKGISEAKRLLKDLRPDVVFSKGGFVAYPVVVAASKLHIPVVIHESDYSLGLANRLGVRHASVICTTFEATQIALSEKYPSKVVLHTGTPLRAEIFKGNAAHIDKMFSHHNGSLASSGRSSGPGRVPCKNLLVIGGSLGAKKINEVVVLALPSLLPKYNVLHVVGVGKATVAASAEHPVSSNGYRQVEYMTNIADAYAWADIVVSRAGSGALSEILALGKRAVFIPMSTGRGDQIENAKEVERLGVAEVIFEDGLNESSLVQAIAAQGDQVGGVIWPNGAGPVIEAILFAVRK